MAQEYKLIDPFIGLPPKGPNPSQDPNIAKWFRNSKALMEGATVEQMVADMDASSIEAAILTAQGAPGLPVGPYSVGQRIDDEGFDAACKEVAGIVARYPGRFYGCAAIDPTGMMKAVRQLERAVHEYGFRSIWMMPALVGLPPNHACYFPIYAKCVELDVAIKINVGVPGPLRPAWVQRPLHLDEVLLAFPELTVVGAHVGHPWQVETVALLQKFPNFYMITSGWAPKHVPQELWQLANSRGARKLLWSSDYPILPMDRCAREGREVPLKDEVKRRYLRENAIEVFKLKL
jgi:uncharacterized protein